MLALAIGYFVVLKEIYQLIIDIQYIEGYNIIAIVLFGIIISGNSPGSTVIMKKKLEKGFYLHLFRFS